MIDTARQSEQISVSPQRRETPVSCAASEWPLLGKAVVQILITKFAPLSGCFTPESRRSRGNL